MPGPGGQDAATVGRNREFFAGERHGAALANLDTYRMIGDALSREVEGIERLLDVGNGGVFGYEPERVGSIVAVDLFLDDLPPERFPPNVTAYRCDALNLTEPEGSFEAVLEAFVFHHIVGKRPSDLVTNVRRALSEARRMLRPNGKLIVGESCVPRWFYGLERVLYRPLVELAKTPLLGGHPATMQLYPEKLLELVGEQFEIERFYRIPHGRWVTQFGRRWPTALTPARPWMVVARKR